MTRAETVRTGKFGKTEFRLVKKDGVYHGMADGRMLIRGEDPDDVWRRLHDEFGYENKRYFGFEGARKLFLHYYPNGFHSVGFSERPYKESAAQRLQETVPLEAAATGSGFGEAVLAVYRATDLLTPRFEQPRVQEVLRGKNADAFIQAAARFTLGGGRQALYDMEHALRPNEAAKWTIVTYLPFLWRPNEHMFLKPEATMDFAERVGHRYAQIYAPSLDVRVYESLLDLAKQVRENLADLKPRDLIDVQSFIWVISGAYAGESPRQ